MSFEQVSLTDLFILQRWSSHLWPPLISSNSDFFYRKKWPSRQAMMFGSDHSSKLQMDSHWSAVSLQQGLSLKHLWNITPAERLGCEACLANIHILTNLELIGSSSVCCSRFWSTAQLSRPNLKIKKMAKHRVGRRSAASRAATIKTKQCSF